MLNGLCIRKAVPPMTALAVALSLGWAGPVLAQQDQKTAPQSASRDLFPESFADLAEAKLPAVVNVATTSAEVPLNRRQIPPGFPELPPGSPFEDFFERFFDEGPIQRRPEQALGSGFIIDPAGYVVSNNHVIAEATSIKVILQDDTELDATVVGRDPRTDVALLKVEPKSPLPAVKWGKSSDMRVGDWVLAIGNPFGLGGTVTSGIISATAREISAGPYDDFIQTDASINQGNSGGPLFNLRGEVIGVNTAIFSPTGGSVGIGFAVPSDSVRDVIAELRETGTVTRGWLGVAIQQITDEIGKALGVDQKTGALVSEVVPSGPAAAAGIQPGDVIVRFAGHDVESPRDLSRTVAQTDVGKSVDVVILRDGKQQTVQVQTGRLPEEPQVAADQTMPPPETEGTASADVGLALSDLTPPIREQFGITGPQEGALVVGVQENSPAADQGFEPGDVITRVGNTPVANAEDAQNAIEQAREAHKQSILVLRERDGDAAFGALPLTEQPG